MPTLLFDLYLAEEGTTGLAAWRQAAVKTDGVDFPHHGAVDLASLDAWGVLPDVQEGELSIGPAIVETIAGTTQGHEHVAALEGAVEAGVGALPAEVQTVSSFWFGKDVFELDLETHGRVCEIM